MPHKHQQPFRTAQNLLEDLRMLSQRTKQCFRTFHHYLGLTTKFLKTLQSVKEPLRCFRNLSETVKNASPRTSENACGTFQNHSKLMRKLQNAIKHTNMSAYVSKLPETLQDPWKSLRRPLNILKRPRALHNHQQPFWSTKKEWIHPKTSRTS